MYAPAAHLHHLRHLLLLLALTPPGSHVEYPVTSSSALPGWPAGQVAVMRRFKDFVSLADVLKVTAGAGRGGGGGGGHHRAPNWEGGGSRPGMHTPLPLAPRSGGPWPVPAPTLRLSDRCAQPCQGASAVHQGCGTP
jgi:hypothetical protein